VQDLGRQLGGWLRRMQGEGGSTEDSADTP
jgi:hypothetical protein